MVKHSCWSALAFGTFLSCNYCTQGQSFRWPVSFGLLAAIMCPCNFWHDMLALLACMHLVSSTPQSSRLDSKAHLGCRYARFFMPFISCPKFEVTCLTAGNKIRVSSLLGLPLTCSEVKLRARGMRLKDTPQSWIAPSSLAKPAMQKLRASPPMARCLSRALQMGLLR